MTTSDFDILDDVLVLSVHLRNYVLKIYHMENDIGIIINDTKMVNTYMYGIWAVSAEVDFKGQQYVWEQSVRFYEVQSKNNDLLFEISY